MHTAAGATDPTATSKTPKPLSPAAAMQASLDKQRASIQKQRSSFGQQPGMKPGMKPKMMLASNESLASSGPFIEPIAPFVQMDCPALPADQVDSLISDAAQQQNVDPALIRAVMRQESAFHPCAVSNKGAEGLMQLMPTTAAQFHVADTFDPQQNVAGGTALLKQLLARYNGDVRLALVAYNAGANRADDKSERYPAETQHYIANILGELGIPSRDASPQSPEPMEPVADETAQSDPSAPTPDAAAPATDAAPAASQSTPAPAATDPAKAPTAVPDTAKAPTTPAAPAAAKPAQP